MKKEKAIECILISLLSDSIDNKISFLEDHTKLLKEIKYNNEAFNDLYRRDFNEYKEALQNVVDSFYFGYYEVNGWKNLTTKNYKEAVKENISILKSMKKLVKFVS